MPQKSAGPAANPLPKQRDRFTPKRYQPYPFLERPWSVSRPGRDALLGRRNKFEVRRLALDRYLEPASTGRVQAVEIEQRTQGLGETFEPTEYFAGCLVC